MCRTDVSNGKQGKGNNGDIFSDLVPLLKFCGLAMVLFSRSVSFATEAGFSLTGRFCNL